MVATGDATQLLALWSAGDAIALNQVVELLYDQMHRIAKIQMRSEQEVSFQPAELVNDVYLRLIQLNRIQVSDRAHFLALFSRMARQTLVDEARKRHAQMRDQALNVTLNEDFAPAITGKFRLIELDELMYQLALVDAIASEVVELRIFAGLSIQEVAAHLKLSEATISRKWRSGKAWLGKSLGRSQP